MRLATRPLGARSLRDLLASARPSVNMPAVTMPTFAGPSVALLAGAMPSVAAPFVTTPALAVASLTMPCTLRALARAAGATLPLLLLRGSARIAAAGIGAKVFARQRHLDEP